MKAIYFTGSALEVVERPQPQVPAGEALLKTRCVGICNTDLELFRGYYGFKGIAGHEFVAEVVQADACPELVGKRVVGDINCACRACSWCLSGRHRHCPNRTTLGIVGRDGAFAEYFTLPVANLLAVPDTLSDEKAVFCELLAAALEPGQQVAITNQDRVLILGDGKLGLLMAMGLRFAAPNLLLVGKHADKLAIAAGLGVRTKLLDPAASESLAAELGPFDLVIEATGKEDGPVKALRHVRPEGTLVLKTTSHKPTEMDIAQIVVDEINIIGSRCGDMDLGLRYLANTWVDPAPLIEARYAFAAFPEAFARAQQPGAKKVLVTFTG